VGLVHQVVARRRSEAVRRRVRRGITTAPKPRRSVLRRCRLDPMRLRAIAGLAESSGLDPIVTITVRWPLVALSPVLPPVACVVPKPESGVKR